MGGCFFLTFNYDISRETFASERESGKILFAITKKLELTKRKSSKKLTLSPTSCQHQHLASKILNFQDFVTHHMILTAVTHEG